MPNIWTQIKNWFSDAETSSASRPFIHEVIVRSESEKEDYEQWKDSLTRRRLIDWLMDQYAMFQVLPERMDEAIDFLNTPSSKGFVIHFYKTKYDLRDVTWLFDYLKEQVLRMEYKTQVSDLRSYSKNKSVETVERHYLKPRFRKDKQGRSNQQFGNINIESIQRDGKAFQLKFQATVYHNHKYTEGAAFKELLQKILV